MIQDEGELPSHLEASAAPVQAMLAAGDTALNNSSCGCKRRHQDHSSSVKRPRKMLEILGSATKTDLHVTRNKAKDPVHGVAGANLTQDHSQ